MGKIKVNEVLKRHISPSAEGAFVVAKGRGSP